MKNQRKAVEEEKKKKKLVVQKVGDRGGMVNGRDGG